MTRLAVTEATLFADRRLLPPSEWNSGVRRRVDRLATRTRCALTARHVHNVFITPRV